MVAAAGDDDHDYSYCTVAYASTEKGEREKETTRHYTDPHARHAVYTEYTTWSVNMSCPFVTNMLPL